MKNFQQAQAEVQSALVKTLYDGIDEGFREMLTGATNAAQDSFEAVMDRSFGVSLNSIEVTAKDLERLVEDTLFGFHAAFSAALKTQDAQYEATAKMMCGILGQSASDKYIEFMKYQMAILEKNSKLLTKEFILSEIKNNSRTLRIVH